MLEIICRQAAVMRPAVFYILDESTIVLRSVYPPIIGG
jgi:hypothetical protein